MANTIIGHAKLPNIVPIMSSNKLGSLYGFVANTKNHANGNEKQMSIL